MQSNIFDTNGVEVQEGDILVFPYITPHGDKTSDIDFKAKVVFKYGSFGFDTETRFIPLLEWMDTGVGEYVANFGNKTVYLETYPFWVETTN